MGKHVQNLKIQIQRLKDRIHQIPETELSAKASLIQWSKKEIVGHLIDSAVNNLKRFTDILATDTLYTVHPYRQNQLVEVNAYQSLEIRDLMILWQALNTQICHVIERLSDEQLKTTILIQEKEHTLDFLISDYVSHLEHHINQILEIRGQGLPVPVKISPEQAQEMLAKVPSEFALVLNFCDLEVEYYRPIGTDKQTPHSRDELYVIASGTASFFLEGESVEVKSNDVLFVKAHKEHRFVDFSDDFSTWVIFWGQQR